MAFGPIMRLKVGDLKIELAPVPKDDLQEFVSPGMQQASVTRYLENRAAPVLEDEVEWFERVRQGKDSVVWGIYVYEGERRVLIGNTGLHAITYGHIIQSTSGSMIFRKEYWGRGIASRIHMARTWYVFRGLGHTRIKSAVTQGNVASRKALDKSGYSLVSVERNTNYVDGKLRHRDNLECLNPDDAAWRLWWGDDQPTKEAEEARARTRAAMDWAEANVELP